MSFKDIIILHFGRHRIFQSLDGEKVFEQACLLPETKTSFCVEIFVLEWLTTLSRSNNIFLNECILGIIRQIVTSENTHCRGKFHCRKSGQSYKRSMIVIYVSRVVNISNLLVSTTPQLYLRS